MIHKSPLPKDIELRLRTLGQERALEAASGQTQVPSYER